VDESDIQSKGEMRWVVEKGIEMDGKLNYCVECVVGRLVGFVVGVEREQTR
jgi:hypothetical protein